MLRPGQSAQVRVVATAEGYLPGSATRTEAALGEAHTPIFGDDITRTAGGFDVAIENYAQDDIFEWTVTPEGGGAVIDADGVLRVTGLADGQEADVVVRATNPGYMPGQDTVTGRALNEALPPQLSGTTPTADGFTVRITNLDPAYTWTGSADPSGSVAVNGSGLVTVTGVAPDTATDLTVRSTRNGYRPGSTTVSETSLKAAWVPQLSPATRTADGFTVRIGNYDAAYDWSLQATNTTVEVDLDTDSGIVNVTGVAPGTSSRLSITTRRAGHAVGRAGVTETARRGTAMTPEFGAVTRTATGFTVPIRNGMAGFRWSASTTRGRAAISGQTLAVTGLAPNQSAVATVTARRTGYLDGTARVAGRALAATAADTTRATKPAAPAITAAKVKKSKKAAKIVVTVTAGATGGAPVIGAQATCTPTKKKRGVVSRTVTRTATGTRIKVSVGKVNRRTTYKCTASVINAVGTSLRSPVKRVKVK